MPVRWMQHKKLLRRVKHHSRHLQHAWNRYGESAFTFVVVEYVVPSMLLIVEQKHLDEWPSYNVANDATSSMLGRKHSYRTRELMSNQRRGRKRGPCSEETKAKISKTNLGHAPTPGFGGRHHSSEAKIAIAAKTIANHTGRKRSAESRLRMSDAAKTKPRSEKQLVHIANLAKRRRGTKCSPETRKKMSAWQIGKQVTPETCAKISAALKARTKC